ncbi:MAG TPA: hypothetical protein VI299_00765 [Polyangiales bacterium]
MSDLGKQVRTRWDRGEFQVQLVKQGSTRPMGFCDGSGEDEAALREIAEGEGADGVRIEKQLLKSGRQTGR